MTRQELEQLEIVRAARKIGMAFPSPMVERIAVPLRPHPINGRGMIDQFVAYLDDEGGGRGRLTICGWGRAWTAWWGAMGGTLRHFVMGADREYIAGKMVPLGIMKAKQEASDESIVPIMVQALLDELWASEAGTGAGR